LKNAKGTSKSFDGGTRSLERSKMQLNGAPQSYSFNQSLEETKEREADVNLDDKANDFPTGDTEDSVPGILYELLQKEVMALRKSSNEKDQSLKDKDDAIEVSILFIIVFGC
jgi:hypothetical protein